MAICTKVREERDKAIALAQELAKALEGEMAKSGRHRDCDARCSAASALARAREAGLLSEE